MPKELKGDMNGQGLQIGVVVARFNEIITNKLLDSAIQTLERHGVKDEDKLELIYKGSLAGTIK